MVIGDLRHLKFFGNFSTLLLWNLFHTFTRYPDGPKIPKQGSKLDSVEAKQGSEWLTAPVGESRGFLTIRVNAGDAKNLLAFLRRVNLNQRVSARR
jgi:hypothetical protein